MSKRKKYLIIDADDTLYRIGGLPQAYARMFTVLASGMKMSVPQVEIAFQRELAKVRKSSNPQKRQREYLVGRMTCTQALAKRALASFWKEILKKLSPTPGVGNFLRFACRKYKIIISSDEFRLNLLRKLRRTFGKKYKRYFFDIITPEDVGYMKPHEGYISTAMVRHGIKKEDIEMLIGDDEKRDFKFAGKFKLKTGLYRHKKHRQRVRKKRVVFGDFSELMDLL